MACIALSAVPLTTLKKLARTALPEVKSAHLSEALASAVGYGTHAALLADLPAQAADPAIVLLDEQRFGARLTDLGYPAPEKFSFETFTEPRFSVDRTTSRRKRIDYERQLAHVDGVISTTSFSNGPHAYKSARGKAWGACTAPTSMAASCAVRGTASCAGRVELKACADVRWSIITRSCVAC